MTRVCTVCRHKKLEEINKQLINGESYRSISKLFGVSEQSILRHKENHISELLFKSKEITDLAQADNLTLYLNTEYQDIKNIKKQAIEKGNHDLTLKAIDRSLKTIEIVAKVYGLIQKQSININILQNPEWLELRTKIVKALDPYPEAKLAVVNALK